MSASPALQQALRLRGQPDLLSGLQRAPLPPDMTGLIRIVTGESAATDAERSAAAGFLEQVCLHAGADPRRCLALQAHDDLVTARTHHRLLIKWLHPDRNPGTQDLAERVNSAWTALKNPQPLMAGTAPDLAVTPGRRSRFPVFLGVLLLAALALLALSLMPDAPVYVDTPAQAEAPVQPAPDAAMTKALAALPPASRDAAPPEAPSVPVAAKPAQVLAATAPAASVPVKAVPVTAPPKTVPEKTVASVPKPVAPTPRALPSASPTPTPTPVAVATVDAISTEEAEAVLQQYRAHYSAGNLPGLMALFSPKAISLKGGREAIAADYSRLFGSTRQRRIALSNPRWQAVDEARRLRAGFQTELAYADARAPQRRSGQLEMLLVRENGNPRILELLITE